MTYDPNHPPAQEPQYAPPRPEYQPNYQGPQYGQPDGDAEHIRILSICWYLISGLVAFLGFFPFIHLTLGILLATRTIGHRDDWIVGIIFIIFASLAILLAWTGAILGFITARSLPKRRRKMLCYATAGLACLWVPFGTTLGVFTFIVLSRPSIRSSFQ
jgi:hypothetical protein